MDIRFNNQKPNKSKALNLIGGFEIFSGHSQIRRR
jgi:hypothetical protein